MYLRALGTPAGSGVMLASQRTIATQTARGAGKAAALIESIEDPVAVYRSALSISRLVVPAVARAILGRCNNTGTRDVLENIADA